MAFNPKCFFSAAYSYQASAHAKIQYGAGDDIAATGNVAGKK